jgi:outer membrane protein assembly factor BamB
VTFARLLAAACAGALLCACGGVPRNATLDWPMYQNGTTHQAIVDVPFPALDWVRNLHAKINGGMAYDGAALYAVDFGKELVALDPLTGKVFWRSGADDVLMSTPIVARNVVFVGSGTSKVMLDTRSKTVWGRKDGNHWYAFDARTGRTIWSYPVTGEAMPSAAYDKGRLIFATGDDAAIALDAATAKLLWKTRLPGVATMGSAMVRGDSVYFVTTQGKTRYADPARSHTLALRTSDGSIRWSVPYGNADCTPTVAQGLVFVEGAKDGPRGALEPVGTNDVSALDERTGKLRWHYQSPPGYYTEVASNERAITGTYDGGVLYQSIPAIDAMAAFRASDGHVLWMRPTSGPVKMSPLVYRGNVYFGDTAGLLYKLGAKDGSVRTVRQYAHPFSTSAPIIVGKTFFFAADQEVFAFPLQKI